jgi:hypothetical protein
MFSELVNFGIVAFSIFRLEVNQTDTLDIIYYSR